MLRYHSRTGFDITPAPEGASEHFPHQAGHHRALKTFSTSEDSFWCCMGTGMESHAKYSDTIYFRDDQALYVNLFIASELKWQDKGLIVRQETQFPDEDITKLTLRSERPVKLALKIRYPSWAQSGMTLTINGMKENLTGNPSSYVTIEREWKHGDTVQVRLPMRLRAEVMPDNPKMVALVYGPIVLAGDLGQEGLESARRYGPSAPQLSRVRQIEIPAFVGDPNEVLAKIKPVPGAPLNFRTTGIGAPRDVLLVPFHRIVEPRYTVYWAVYSPAEWHKRKTDRAAESRREEIERRTVDAVNVAEPQSERVHRFQGKGTIEGMFEGRGWRAARNGWFSYELKVVPDKPVTVVCTYAGSDGRRRAFDVLVDDENVATQTLENQPGELFDFEYPLPENLTLGKQFITLKFQAHADAIAGSVVDVRVAQIAQ
jgi:hypothetical protein